MERFFHSELEHLKSKLILQGEKCYLSANSSVNGFKDSNTDECENALQLEPSIIELEKEIIHAAIRYITLQNPVSSDVRLLFALIKISNILLRVSSESCNIARKTKVILSSYGKTHYAPYINTISDHSLNLLQDSISSFINEDLKLAQTIEAKEQESVNTVMIDFFKENKESQRELLLISNSMEQVSNYSKEIAQNIIYLLTGQ
ncbi:MAG: phosphate signaling complex PhoU family protein [Coraliomargaritaceae bacterium]